MFNSIKSAVLAIVILTPSLIGCSDSSFSLGGRNIDGTWKCEGEYVRDLTEEEKGGLTVAFLPGEGEWWNVHLESENTVVYKDGTYQSLGSVSTYMKPKPEFQSNVAAAANFFTAELVGGTGRESVQVDAKGTFDLEGSTLNTVLSGNINMGGNSTPFLNDVGDEELNFISSEKYTTSAVKQGDTVLSPALTCTRVQK